MKAALICVKRKRDVLRSADAFTQVVILVQPIDLRPLKVAARDDAPDPSALDDRKMSEAAITHLPQSVDCAAMGSDRDWIGRHRIRQDGHCAILAFGKRTHRVAAGEDAGQALLAVDYQHRARATLPHAPAGFLHRCALRQYKRLLILDDIRELSVGHDASVSAGSWGP